MVDISPPSTPHRSHADAVYYVKGDTKRKATYRDGHWYCSCEFEDEPGGKFGPHNRMERSRVLRGDNAGRWRLRCRNLGSNTTQACGIHILTDEPDFVALEERLKPRTGRQTKLAGYGFVPYRRQQGQRRQGQPNANELSPQLTSTYPPQSGYSGNAATGDEFRSPSPARRGAARSAAPPLADARRLPSRPLRGRRQWLATASTSDESDGGGRNKVGLARESDAGRPARHSASDVATTPGNVSDGGGVGDASATGFDGQISDEYGSWGQDDTYDLIELAESVEKSRPVSKGPKIQNTPSVFPNAASRTHPLGSPHPTGQRDEDTPGPFGDLRRNVQPTRRVLWPNLRQAPRRVVPGSFPEGSPSDSECEADVESPNGAVLEAIDQHTADANIGTGGGGDAKLAGEAEERIHDDEPPVRRLGTPSQHTTITNGMPTPNTAHVGSRFARPSLAGSDFATQSSFTEQDDDPLNRSFSEREHNPVPTSPSSSSYSPSTHHTRNGKRKRRCPSRPFEDNFEREVFATLSRSSVSLTPAVRSELRSNILSMVHSTKKMLRERNDKKKEMRRLKHELEGEQAAHRHVRSRKEGAQVDLLMIA